MKRIARLVLITLAALANTSLWVKAGILAEGSDPLAYISSVCLGLAISGGLVYIAEQWAAMPDEVERRIPRTKPAEYEQVTNGRKQIAAWSFGVTLTAEIFMLAPVIIALESVARMSEILAPVVMWLWALGRPLVAVLVMGGLAVVAEPQKSQSAKVQTVPAASVPVSAKPTDAPAPVVPAPAPVEMEECEICHEEYKKRGGKGGHYKKHHPKGTV